MCENYSLNLINLKRLLLIFFAFEKNAAQASLGHSRIICNLDSAAEVHGLTSNKDIYISFNFIVT